MPSEDTTPHQEAAFSLEGNTEDEVREYNMPLYGVQGQFTLTPGVTVPYFASLMSIDRLTTELKTHEEVTPSLENTYTLEELFQREIDLKTINNIVDGYLNSHNKLKFFNSITVALFPKDNSGKICPNFEDYQNNNPKIPAEGAGSFDSSFANKDNCENIVFGGVQFVKTQVANLARLRWDRKKVYAMAVDGQHRLKALKVWHERKNKELTKIESPTRISVIFLLLHPNAGFQRAIDDQTDGIKGIAREIFTDLNKNARQVDEATQIVLDDRSLESRCVRAIVTPSTCEDSEHLLPLSLLRWREANNRFDQRYYLNSLVNLHLIVKDLLGLQMPQDPMSANEVRRYIHTLENTLGDFVDGKKSILYEGKSLLEAYESDFFDTDSDDPSTPIRPFIGIPPAFLPAAVEGFKKHYAPWILSILRDFKPYKQLLAYAREKDLIKGQFSQFHAQPKSAQHELIKSLESEHGNNWKEVLIFPHEKEIMRIKGDDRTNLGDQWAFKTIFQKAILRLAKRISLQTDEEVKRMGKVEDYISFLDDLYERNILRVLSPIENENYKFWTFITLHHGTERIQVTAASEKRIESFLQIAYTGIRYACFAEKEISETPSGATFTPRKILNDISTQNSHTEWRAYDASKLLTEFMTKNAHIIDLSLGEKEQDGTLTGTALERKKKEVGRDRLIALLSKCWLSNEGYAAAPDEDGDMI